MKDSTFSGFLNILREQDVTTQNDTGDLKYKKRRYFIWMKRIIRKAFEK